MGTPRAYLLDLDGTLYAGGAAIPGAAEALARLREQAVPYRLVTNTTSRSRAMLVERLRGYGFDASPDEVFTATLAGKLLARTAGYRESPHSFRKPALADIRDLDLAGGTSGRTSTRSPDAVLLGDLGERWSYALLQEAFEYVMGGADLVALSRDRYWLQGDRLALDAGPFVAALEFATGKQAAVAGKPSPAFYAAALSSLGLSSRRRRRWLETTSGPTWRAPNGRGCKAGWCAPVSTGSPYSGKAASGRTGFSTALRRWHSGSLIFRHSPSYLGAWLHLRYLLPLAALMLPIRLRAQNTADSAPPPDPSLILYRVQLQPRDIFDPEERSWLARHGQQAALPNPPCRDPAGDPASSG